MLLTLRADLLEKMQWVVQRCGCKPATWSGVKTSYFAVGLHLSRGRIHLPSHEPTNGSRNLHFGIRAACLMMVGIALRSVLGEIERTASGKKINHYFAGKIQAELVCQFSDDATPIRKAEASPLRKGNWKPAD